MGRCPIHSQVTLQLIFFQEYRVRVRTIFITTSTWLKNTFSGKDIAKKMIRESIKLWPYHNAERRSPTFTDGSPSSLLQNQSTLSTTFGRELRRC